LLFAKGHFACACQSADTIFITISIRYRIGGLSSPVSRFDTLEKLGVAGSPSHDRDLTWTAVRWYTESRTEFPGMEAQTMRSILSLIGAAVVIFAGAGWYLGWYTFGTQNGNLELEVKSKKVVSDLKAGEKKIEDAVHNSGTPNTPKTVEGQTTSNNGAPIIVLPKLETNTGK
jgi:hypothetical protein